MPRYPDYYSPPREASPGCGLVLFRLIVLVLVGWGIIALCRSWGML